MSSVLAGYGASQPDRSAILAPGRPPLTYGGLKAQQDYVRNALAGWGIARGDVVAVMLPKGPEMAVAIATLPVSATIFPLNGTLSSAEYENLFRRAAAKALVVPRGLVHAACAAAANQDILLIELDFDVDAPAGMFILAASGGAIVGQHDRRLGPDVACIMCTSGTTEYPKLIPQPHSHFIIYAKAMATWLAYEPSDVTIHLVPMHFSHGILSALIIPLLNGTAIVCPPDFQTKAFFAQLEEYRPTWISAGFTIYRDMLSTIGEYKQIAKNTPLRFLRSASGRLEPAEIRRLEEIFEAPLIVPLSSTETGLIACNPLPPGKRSCESVGLRVVNEVEIRDTTGRSVEANQAGEIMVRGPLVFEGYLGEPEATDQAFVDGWYRTGDLGRFDAEGYLYVTGRIKDVINRGGVKISPMEIDRVLESQTGIAEAAAFGLPHPTLGEVVAAAVVPQQGAQIDTHEIERQAVARLALHKVPIKIFVVESLPRTQAGKLQRQRIAGILANRG